MVGLAVVVVVALVMVVVMVHGMRKTIDHRSQTGCSFLGKQFAGKEDSIGLMVNVTKRGQYRSEEFVCWLVA